MAAALAIAYILLTIACPQSPRNSIKMLKQNEYYVFQFIMNYSTRGMHFI